MINKLNQWIGKVLNRNKNTEKQLDTPTRTYLRINHLDQLVYTDSELRHMLRNVQYEESEEEEKERWIKKREEFDRILDEAATEQKKIEDAEDKRKTSIIVSMALKELQKNQLKTNKAKGKK